MMAQSILLTLNGAYTDDQAIQAVEALWCEECEKMVLVWLVAARHGNEWDGGRPSVIGPQVAAYERLSGLAKVLRSRGIAVRIQIRTGTQEKS